MKRRTSAEVLYWLNPGPFSERCRFCLQFYAVETEVRCRHCDVPSCPHCAWEAETDECGCNACEAER